MTVITTILVMRPVRGHCAPAMHLQRISKLLWITALNLRHYTGPIDLLLYLVRRHEVDITDLPIAKITAQFAEFLEVLELIDFDLVGEFVVHGQYARRDQKPYGIAAARGGRARRSTLPKIPAANWSGNCWSTKSSRMPRSSWRIKQHSGNSVIRGSVTSGPPGARRRRSDHIKDVELWDLVSAFSRIVRQIDPEEQKSIVYDDTPISVYIDRVGKRVKQDQRVAFSSFFEGSNSKSKIVGIFLAILELLRNYYYRAVQEDESGEIWVMPPDPNRPRPVENATNADANGESTDVADTVLSSAPDSAGGPLPAAE